MDSFGFHLRHGPNMLHKPLRGHLVRLTISIKVVGEQASFGPLRKRQGTWDRDFTCLAPYTRPLIFGFSNKVSGTGGRMFNA